MKKVVSAIVVVLSMTFASVVSAHGVYRNIGECSFPIESKISEATQVMCENISYDWRKDLHSLKNYYRFMEQKFSKRSDEEMLQVCADMENQFAQDGHEKFPSSIKTSQGFVKVAYNRFRPFANAVESCQTSDEQQCKDIFYKALDGKKFDTHYDEFVIITENYWKFIEDACPDLNFNLLRE